MKKRAVPLNIFIKFILILTVKFVFMVNIAWWGYSLSYMKRMSGKYLQFSHFESGALHGYHWNPPKQPSTSPLGCIPLNPPTQRPNPHYIHLIASTPTCFSTLLPYKPSLFPSRIIIKPRNAGQEHFTVIASRAG